MKMRLAIALASLAILAAAGCSGGEGVSAEDSMESQLKAANVASNKSQAPSRSLSKADRNSQQSQPR
jgi:ABC-type glycerol-3-phosphate transport system substrate-binding protein